MEELGGCIIKAFLTVVLIAILIASELVWPIIIGIIVTCIVLYLTSRIRKQKNCILRRKRLNWFYPYHILAFIIFVIGAVWLLFSIEPVPLGEEWYTVDYRKIIVESNLMKIFVASASLCGAFFFIAKSIACRCYGSEVLALIESEELESEAEIMHRYLRDKMKDNTSEKLNTHISLNNLLRLVHSLGYRITIRKISEENIECNQGNSNRYIN